MFCRIIEQSFNLVDKMKFVLLLAGVLLVGFGVVAEAKNPMLESTAPTTTERNDGGFPKLRGKPGRILDVGEPTGSEVVKLCFNCFNMCRNEDCYQGCLKNWAPVPERPRGGGCDREHFDFHSKSYSKSFDE